MKGHFIDTRDLYQEQDTLLGESHVLAESIEEAKARVTLLHIDGEEPDPDALAEAEEAVVDAEKAFAEFEQDEERGGRMLELQSLLDDVGSEASHGVTLVREDHFADYVEQFLTDCGEIPRDFPNYIVIDWEATADNVREDFNSVTYEGETYLYRV